MLLRQAGAVVPIRSCSRWGLPCRPCFQGRGGLLPHPFTLTPPVNRPICIGLAATDGPIYRRGGLLSVALSLGLPPPAVSRHRVSVEPGLSSPPIYRPICNRQATIKGPIYRRGGRPADWHAV